MKAFRLSLSILFLLAPLYASAQERPLDSAKKLLDGGRLQEALDLVEAVLAQQPENAEALLYRSTARLQMGELKEGRKDLERSLRLDPRQRQGWLNLAGLEVAEQNYDAALAAFGEARRLDPKATDNDLNQGAVLLLKGDGEAARGSFARYVKAEGTAQAYYLVAVNYETAGHHKVAMAYLERAIQLDERFRAQALHDKNFLGSAGESDFLSLVNVDRHRLAVDSHKAAKVFGNLPYEPQGVLLKAVLQTLQVSGRPLDPRVEVHGDWALLWSDARVKIRQLEDGRGRVEMTAPADRFTSEEWASYTEDFFQKVAARLLVLEVKQIKQGSR